MNAADRVAPWTALARHAEGRRPALGRLWALVRTPAMDETRRLADA